VTTVIFFFISGAKLLKVERKAKETPPFFCIFFQLPPYLQPHADGRGLQDGNSRKKGCSDGTQECLSVDSQEHLFFFLFESKKEPPLLKNSFGSL
jgi:hypothetical protein